MSNSPSPDNSNTSDKIAIVVPCYKEREQIIDVLSNIGPIARWIFVVDDVCPDNTGDFVQKNTDDPRIIVSRNPKNLGVGGVALSGYRQAIDVGADIIVKLDGDGQMDPALIPKIIAPIQAGQADYSKGNRLHKANAARGMPFVKLFGNIALTFMSKVSSGYWTIMDPANGFTAIHARVAKELVDQDIATGYFFESDLLHRLGGLNAVVQDAPMQAKHPSCLYEFFDRPYLQCLSAHIRHLFRTRPGHLNARACLRQTPALFWGRVQKLSLVEECRDRRSSDSRHRHIGRCPCDIGGPVHLGFHERRYSARPNNAHSSVTPAFR